MICIVNLSLWQSYMTLLLITIIFFRNYAFQDEEVIINHCCILGIYFVFRFFVIYKCNVDSTN